MVLGGALGPGFGAWGAAPLCVAGVAQPDIHLRFTWQAWHKTRIHRRFAWQAWHLWYWVAPLGRDLAPGAPRHFAWQAWHNLTSTFVSRGRRGTNSHLPSFCVAGVALMVLGGALGLGFGAWGAAPLCVAGVAQSDIHFRFTWQAWHKLTSMFCVAGVPRMVLGGALGPGFGARAPRHFAWQAWHNLTSTFVSRSRRGTNSHLPSFCVAGVPLMVLGGALRPSFTHNFVTRSLSHRTFTHLIFQHTILHTPLCHTPSFTTPSFTHNFVTHHLSPHHLSHTTLSHTHTHTIFHTQLCHTLSFTHTIFHTLLCHTHTHHLSSSHTHTHTIFHIPLCHSQLF